MKRLPLAVCALLLVFTGCDADEGTAPTLPLTDAGASATANYALTAAGARLQLQVDLLSDLSLSAPDPGGTCAATHTVRALRLTALPDQGAITIPALPAPIASGATEARLAVRLSAPRAHGDALV